MIIYLHIAKTGGTTMLGYLMRFYKVFHLKTWWVAKWRIPADTECFFSHCPYGMPDKYFPGEHQYITFLRDPVDRIISNYYFVLHSPNHPQNLGFFQCSFKELVQSNQYATFDNGMVRLLAGRQDIGALPIQSEVTNNDLDRAKENLLSFAGIGILDSFDDDLSRLANKFGWSDINYIRQRTGRRPPVDAIDPDVREAIEQRNKFDQELVDFAREIKEGINERQKEVI